MPPVFAHGRLRLYLLKLLDEAPRHGYEVIRLLEERFQGLYAPSAGTVYPRLAKLEAEGLVTHTTEGGRKVYAITDAGRAELADRSGELADLELEIRESVAELAAEIRADVRGAAGDLRREMRAAASEARRGAGRPKAAEPGDHGTHAPHGENGESGEYGDSEAWRAAKEEMRRVKQEWKEQARRAKDESRRARDEAQRARRQAEEAQENARSQAQEEVQRIARRVQEQVQDHFARGDWPTGVREGLTELAKEFGEFGKDFGRGYGRDFGFGRAAGTTDRKTAGRPERPGTTDRSPAQDLSGTPDYSGTPEDFPAAYEPAWAHEDTGGDPARDLDRLLDRFRDDIRDAARDHGVTADQLREARRHLSTAAAHIGVILRTPKA
ncbi:helix-turn-helix transcriptional regulator [Streptomyces sp. ID05-04B]|uniref:helix-turn-helix transcriptional regulator n=1 Tax=unclassified Streptomyces TaxID=2593676 RepID=UPI000D1BCC41|nr:MULTISPECIES: helix-turn-helix transcriptional regulator [unclassified Streptomyces]AVV40527.1 PadR family transcriptional regulator [Streptomyces sp. P3]MDX5570369.1 helix-turn-helix transcriptional regulator [Streptomyces sp. ID05-04B]